MRLLLLFLLFVLLIPYNGTCQKLDRIKPLYKLKKAAGIYVEDFGLSNTDENRFTGNNIVYKEGRVFNYEYSFSDKNGNSLFFRPSDFTGSPLGEWELVPADKKTSNTITGVRMIVHHGLQGFDKFSKDYSQTIIEYRYISHSGEAGFSEHTGVIENEKNIWMHPPRMMLFRILEINPFPFVNLDNTKKWDWKLTIGSNWGDHRWTKWDGLIENEMKYAAKGFVNLQTSFGNIKCRKVMAEGKMPIGNTKLVSYFNEKYGFVKLIYTNIDGSLLTFNLKDMEN